MIGNSSKGTWRGNAGTDARGCLADLGPSLERLSISRCRNLNGLELVERLCSSKPVRLNELPFILSQGGC